MIDMIKLLLTNAKGNPVGIVLAAIALACYGGGQKLAENAIEPFGTILMGFAGLLVLVAGAWMKAHPPPPDPPVLPTPAPPTPPQGPA